MNKKIGGKRWMWVSFAILFICMVFQGVTCIVQASAGMGKMVIVHSSHEIWLNKYAADEFAKYMVKITGRKPLIVKDNSHIPEGVETVVLIGSPVINILTKALDEKDALKVSWESLGRDGFVIKSVLQNKQNYLVLAGKTDLATLYAVYDYLERFCNVGFFFDDERIPNDITPPTTGLDLTQMPYFKVRSQNACLGHMPLKRTHSHSWNMDDWKRYLDWMVKRKLNMTNYMFSVMHYNFLGDVVEKVYGVKPVTNKAVYKGGWPSGALWPNEHRTKMAKEIFKYGRQRGIKFDYLIDLVGVPTGFPEKHPEYKYTVPDTYDQVCFHPSEPALRIYAKKLLQSVIDEYGTDHIYHSSPFTESKLAKTDEESVEMITKATSELCKLLREVDPEAIGLGDTWGIGNTQLWTQERLKRYFAALPKNMLYYYDMGGTTLYKKGNFVEIDWATAFLTSFSGDDHFAGDISQPIAQVNEIINDPLGKNCSGLFITPEILNVNIPYFHMLTKLAWRPDEVLSVDEYIKDYVRHRYSRASFDTMVDAYKELVEAVYHDTDINRGFYKRVSDFPLGLGQAEISDKMSIYERKAGLLKKVLDSTLSVAQNEKGNPLYEQDLVTFSRTYLSFVSNYYFLLSQLAFISDDESRLTEETERTLAPLRGMARILSTRPEYSLKNQINDIMSVPGANPAAEEMVKESCVYYDYCVTDNYEVLTKYFIPRVRNYLNFLSIKLGRGQSQIMNNLLRTNVGVDSNLWTPAPLWWKIYIDWVYSPLGEDFPYRFKGTTLESVKAVLNQVRFSGETVTISPIVKKNPSIPEGSKIKLAIEKDAQYVEGFSSIVSFAETQSDYPDYRGGTVSWFERYQDVPQEIIWKTGLCPEEKQTIFVFNGTNGEGPGEIKLYVNGQYVVSFDSKVEEPRQWSKGEYKLQFVPRGYYSGNNGLYILTVPASQIQKGKSCEIKASHVSGESKSWFMVKDYTDNLDCIENLRSMKEQ